MNRTGKELERKAGEFGLVHAYHGGKHRIAKHGSPADFHAMTSGEILFSGPLKDAWLFFEAYKAGFVAGYEAGHIRGEKIGKGGPA